MAARFDAEVPRPIENRIVTTSGINAPTNGVEPKTGALDENRTRDLFFTKEVYLGSRYEF